MAGLATPDPAIGYTFSRDVLWYIYIYSRNDRQGKVHHE